MQGEAKINLLYTNSFIPIRKGSVAVRKNDAYPTNGAAF